MTLLHFYLGVVYRSDVLEYLFFLTPPSEYSRAAGRVRFSCVMMLFIHIIQCSQRLFYYHMDGTNVRG